MGNKKMEREKVEEIVKKASERFVKTLEKEGMNLSNEAEEQFRKSLFRLSMQDIERLYILI